MSYASRPADELALELLEMVTEPTSFDLTSLAGLSLRYAGDSELFPRIVDKSMEWGYSLEQLMVECREIWLNGFRPTTTTNQGGSGHDTTATA